MVKTSFLFFLILFSLNIFSEEYLCTFPNQEGLTTYERIGSEFKRTQYYVSDFYQITKETEEFIILNQTYDYPDIYTIILDKKNETIIEDYISFDDLKLLARIKGKCLIRH